MKSLFNSAQIIVFASNQIYMHQSREQDFNRVFQRNRPRAVADR